MLAQQRRRAGAHGRGQHHLPARRRPHPGGGDLQRALVGDLEVPDLLDLVAPELHPQRVLLGRREHVEDAAADGEVTALVDQFGPGVAGRHQRLDDLGQLAAGVADRDADRFQVSEVGNLRLQDGTHRGDHHAQRPGAGVGRVGMAQPAQHGQPAADGVGTGREPLVRQRLPAGIERHRIRRQQALQAGHQVLGLATGTGHRQHGAPGASGKGGDRQRAERGWAGQGERPGAGPAGSLDHGGQHGVVEGGIDQSRQAHASSLRGGADSSAPAGCR